MMPMGLPGPTPPVAPAQPAPGAEDAAFRILMSHLVPGGTPQPISGPPPTVPIQPSVQTPFGTISPQGFVPPPSSPLPPAFFQMMHSPGPVSLPGVDPSAAAGVGPLPTDYTTAGAMATGGGPAGTEPTPPGSVVADVASYVANNPDIFGQVFNAAFPVVATQPSEDQGNAGTAAASAAGGAAQDVWGAIPGWLQDPIKKTIAAGGWAQHKTATEMMDAAYHQSKDGNLDQTGFTFGVTLYQAGIGGVQTWQSDPGNAGRIIDAREHGYDMTTDVAQPDGSVKKVVIAHIEPGNEAVLALFYNDLETQSHGAVDAFVNNLMFGAATDPFTFISFLGPVAHLAGAAADAVDAATALGRGVDTAGAATAIERPGDLFAGGLQRAAAAIPMGDTTVRAGDVAAAALRGAEKVAGTVEAAQHIPGKLLAGGVRAIGGAIGAIPETLPILGKVGAAYRWAGELSPRADALATEAARLENVRQLAQSEEANKAYLAAQGATPAAEPVVSGTTPFGPPVAPSAPLVVAGTHQGALVEKVGDFSIAQDKTTGKYWVATPDGKLATGVVHDNVNDARREAHALAGVAAPTTATPAQGLTTPPPPGGPVAPPESPGQPPITSPPGTPAQGLTTPPPAVPVADAVAGGVDPIVATGEATPPPQGPVDLVPANANASTPPAEPGYAYHATNVDRLYDIRDAGSVDVFPPNYGTDQTVWPDGSTSPRSYWSDSPKATLSFAPEEGQAVILRRRADGLAQERGTGDLYAASPTPTGAVDYWGSDGQWHPLSGETPPPGSPVTIPTTPTPADVLAGATIPTESVPTQASPSAIAPSEATGTRTLPDPATHPTLATTYFAPKEGGTRAVDLAASLPTDQATAFYDAYEPVAKAEYGRLKTLDQAFAKAPVRETVPKGVLPASYAARRLDAKAAKVFEAVRHEQEDVAPLWKQITGQDLAPTPRYVAPMDLIRHGGTRDQAVQNAFEQRAEVWWRAAEQTTGGVAGGAARMEPVDQLNGLIEAALSPGNDLLATDIRATLYGVQSDHLGPWARQLADSLGKWRESLYGPESVASRGAIQSRLVRDAVQNDGRTITGVSVPRRIEVKGRVAPAHEVTVTFDDGSTQVIRENTYIAAVQRQQQAAQLAGLGTRTEVGGHAVGDTVEIKAGPYAGQRGAIAGVDPDRGYVSISVTDASGKTRNLNWMKPGNATSISKDIPIAPSRTSAGLAVESAPPGAAPLTGSPIPTPPITPPTDLGVPPATTANLAPAPAPGIPVQESLPVVPPTEPATMPPGGLPPPPEPIPPETPPGSPIEAATAPPPSPDAGQRWPGEPQTAAMRRQYGPLWEQAKQAPTVDAGVNVFLDHAKSEAGDRNLATYFDKNGTEKYRLGTTEGRKWQSIDAQISAFRRGWDNAPRTGPALAAPAPGAAVPLGGATLDRTDPFGGVKTETWFTPVAGTGPGGLTPARATIGPAGEDRLAAAERVGDIAARTDPAAKYLFETPNVGGKFVTQNGKRVLVGATQDERLGDIFFRHIDEGMSKPDAIRATMTDLSPSIPMGQRGLFRRVLGNTSAIAKENTMYSYPRVGVRVIGDNVGNFWTLVSNGKFEAAAGMLAQLTPTEQSLLRTTLRDVRGKTIDGLAGSSLGDELRTYGLVDPESVLVAEHAGREEVARGPQTTANRLLQSKLGEGPGKAVGAALTATGIAGSDTLKQVVAANDTVARGVLLQTELRTNLGREYPAFADEVRASAVRNGVDGQALLDGLGTGFSPADVRRLGEQAGFAQGDAEALARTWRGATTRSLSAAGDETNRLFFTYRSTNLDEELKKVFFFHYWMTRASPLYLETALRNPAVLGTYDRMGKELQRQCSLQAGSQCGYLQMFRFASGMGGAFNPLFLISSTFIKFEPDFQNPSARGIDAVLSQIPVMLAPAMQGALAAVGWSSRSDVDPLMTTAGRRWITGLVNLGKQEGWWGDKSIAVDPTEQWLQSMYGATSDWFANSVHLPWAQKVVEKIGNRNDIVLINNRIQDLVLAHHNLPLDTDLSAPQNKAVEDEIVAAQLAAWHGTAGNVYADQAKSEWAWANMAKVGALAGFSGTTLSSNTLDARRAIAHGAIPVTPAEQQAAKSQTGLAQAGSPLALDLMAQGDAYHSLGTDLTRAAVRIYNNILYYKPGNVIPAVTVGGHTYTPDELVAMPQDESDPSYTAGAPTRKLVATLFAADHGLAAPQAEQYKLEDAFKANVSNQEYADYLAWEKSARAKGRAYWENISPAYKQYTDSLADNLKDQLAFAPGAYLAMKGERASLYSDKPLATIDTSKVNPVDLVSGGGTPAAKPAAKKDPALQLALDIQRYNTDSAVFDLTLQQVYGNPNIHWATMLPIYQNAVRTQFAQWGVTPPSKPASLSTYESWAAARMMRGLSTSVGDYAAWLDQVNPILTSRGVDPNAVITAATNYQLGIDQPTPLDASAGP